MNNSLPISKEKALALLKNYPQEKSDMNHYLESAAVMKEVAKFLGEDEEYYEMIGLLHDVDWSLTKSNPKEHLTKAPEILKKEGFDEEFIKVIVSHGKGWDCAGLLNDKRSEKIEFILAASETITGIIHAYALMRNRKIGDMEISGLKKKFKDKNFAANCNREIILEIEKAGISLDDFFKIAIQGIRNIKEQVDLL